MNRRLIHPILLLISTCLALLAFPPLFAQLEISKEPLQFESLEQEMRFTALTMELRCTVCQNQNLADSDAPLAQDLRRRIHDMMLEGMSDEEIKSFLVERYGDFVLYRPPFQGNTMALWLIPVVLLGVGAVAVLLAVRRRRLTSAGRIEAED
jgi:cytochrome c-type biogenesis protein CcmH